MNNAIPMIYIRVDGYKKEMSQDWNTLKACSEEKNVLKEEHRFIGLFHNHPSSPNYKEAIFLDCIATKEKVYRNGLIENCVVNEGLFAKFEFSCKQEIPQLMWSTKA